ncbi:MAG: hypothetical protein KGI54_13135 [Pseudomonadota bacterium]|nr:hypothetical protein [Pseudomonadota bacterium]
MIDFRMGSLSVNAYFTDEIWNAIHASRRIEHYFTISFAVGVSGDTSAADRALRISLATRFHYLILFYRRAIVKRNPERK